MYFEGFRFLFFYFIYVVGIYWRFLDILFVILISFFVVCDMLLLIIIKLNRCLKLYLSLVFFLIIVDMMFFLLNDKKRKFMYMCKFYDLRDEIVEWRRMMLIY